MYLEPDGVILWETHYDGRIRRSVVTGWEGGRFAVISCQFVSEDVYPGQILVLGPYRVRLLRQCPWRDGWLAVRVDHWLWFHLAVYKVTRILELAYYRFILTLGIWQLAETHLGAYPSWRDINPSWRDIKLVAWFGKKLEKKETTLDV